MWLFPQSPRAVIIKSNVVKSSFHKCRGLVFNMGWSHFTLTVYGVSEFITWKWRWLWIGRTVQSLCVVAYRITLSRQSFGTPADPSKEPHCYVYKYVVSWHPSPRECEWSLAAWENNNNHHHHHPPLVLHCMSCLHVTIPLYWGYTPRSIVYALLSQLNTKSCVLDGCLRCLVSFSKFSVRDLAHSPMPINFTAHQIYLLNTMKPIALENLIESF